jgi:putative membrane protein
MPDLDLGAVALLATATALYLRAVLVLARRGYRVPKRQQAAWYGGMAFWAAGLLSPIDAWSEELLSAHMAQHLLFAELGGPLLLLGLRTPVVQFFLPRPALVSIARRRRLRRGLRVFRHPVMAIALYVIVLYAWHLAFLFEAALRNGAVHALQHQSFLLISVLVWWPALEPERRRLRGELWKAGHIVAARMAGMFLAMALVVMRTPAYAGFYGDAARDYGLSPLEDQQLAAGMMLALDLAIILIAVGFFFWRSAQDHDIAERAERERAEPTLALPGGGSPS